MFKKEPGIEGMVGYLDYISNNFSAVGVGLPSIELLVDLGRKLDGDVLKIECNRVPGCVSNVYIDAKFDDKLKYFGSSDSLVVGGYVHILCTAFSGLTPFEVVNDTKNSLEDFLSKTKLQANLTPSRANALYNIYNLIVRKASKYV